MITKEIIMSLSPKTLISKESQLIFFPLNRT